jgi:hypothetical protein
MSRFKVPQRSVEYEEAYSLCSCAASLSPKGDFSKRQDGFGKADAISLADILLTTLGE